MYHLSLWKDSLWSVWKKRFCILLPSDSFLSWRLSYLLHHVVDTLRIWFFLKQRFQIWVNQLLKEMNQRCQWPNTKEVCLFICNRSWLGAGLLPMVIQGPKSLLSWISIIPSLLLGTEEEGEEGTHSISENHACCLTSHSYELGTTVPVICCPLETT